MASFAATTLARLSSDPAPPETPASPRAADPITGTRVNTARLLCAALRSAAADLARQAALPPPPGGLSMVLAVLWSRTHKFDAADSRWPDRDRFVLSCAAATPLLYALLQLSGHPGMEQDTLDQCEGLEAADRFAIFGHHPAVEAAASPGGQAIAMAVGMAITERLLAARFGKSLVDHRVWVVADAAELTQGVTNEAAAVAGQLRLDRLVLVSNASDPEADDARARYVSLGWAVKSVLSDDPLNIDSALSFALRSRKPTLLWCAPSARLPLASQVTANAVEAWRRVGSRGSGSRRAWLKRMARHPQRAEFDRVQSGRLPESLHETLAALKRQLKVSREPQSPAEICGQILDRLVGCVPEMVCGRVDHVLPAWHAQRAPGRTPQHQCGGPFIHYSNRPHGMAACANGIALHGGLLPFTACSVVDVVEQLPALRLAAMQRRRMIHLAFDPGFEEPGTNWHPTELLAWLRAIPNLQVFHPGCAIETTECIELALRRVDAPSVLVVSRTVTPALRRDCVENRSARGGYVLAEAEGPREATVMATGKGLVAAMAARDILAAEGIATAVVSLPCWTLFAAQDEAFRRFVLGDVPRFGVEAAGRCGWDRWLNESGSFIGCDDFDADGPADPVRRLQGLSPEVIAETIRRRLASIA